ncbi:hypothetical protein CC1G_08461 [Coprinopsis cinerea okayama7|uniref:Uncharacterized protein n=1 Tax=Coprinopsis cinerea (strain Okayama-7 / 130 / ATCC MYA-4618 / FGSC 9003) TaxID=240176 RepID=A8NM05_COPC7|nr:hypothetical protein CC1G_08461 [Coprinopsis cinerea okayama7\|eukprot:XP_001834816.2 hypothetical protein CC1G_08461 [Coprinopsis cinerea okayama7\
MGGRWANQIEWDWLVGMTPRWLACTNAEERKNFIAEMTTEFMTRFPIKKGSDADVQLYGEVRALDIANYKRRKELGYWFYNNTRPSSGGARGILQSKKKKKRHTWQAYSHLYWDKGLEKKVNDKCKEDYGKVLEDFPPRERLPIRHKLVEHFFKEETEAVREEVEEWRNSEVKIKRPLTNDLLVQNIAKVPKTMKVFSEIIDEETDWVGTMVMGGPHPMYGGEPVHYIRVWGTNKDGLSFEQYLGERGYKRWAKKVTKWIASCYDSHDRERRKLDGNHQALQPEQSDDETSDDDSNSDSDNDDEMVIDVDNDVDKENGGARATNKEKGKGKQTRTKKSKSTTMPLQSGSNANKPVSDSNKSAPKDSNNAKAALSSKAGATETGKSTYELDRDARIAQNKVIMGIVDKSIEEGSIREKLVEELAAVGVVLTEDALADMLNSIAKIFDQDKSKENKENKAAEENEESSPNTDDAQPPATNTNNAQPPATNTNNAQPPATNTDDAQPPATNTNNAQPPATNTNDAEKPMDVDAQPPATSTGDAEKAMDVDGPPPPEEPLSLKGVSVPAYMKATWPYLLGLSLKRVWRSLLLAFASFEAQKPKTGNLSTDHRPKEVQAWIRSHKKDVPPDVKLEVFVDQFLRWYRSLQPAWRVDGFDGTDPSAFSREVPSDPSWGLYPPRRQRGVLHDPHGAFLVDRQVPLESELPAAPSGSGSSRASTKRGNDGGGRTRAAKKRRC